jgi:hypothetical protein
MSRRRREVVKDALSVGGRAIVPVAIAGTSGDIR